MTLAAGSRLGPYEVLAPLGAGGMGEVYRARDTRLERTVAIKVLPEHLSASPEVRQRFEREAKTISQLSHPNILAIFDFGTHEGTAYAVTELLEGETLRWKLAAGPIPQKQAVDYGLQIARGLSAAHEKGIVHRDLKPENVFVTRGGHIKILDFGLAKRTERIIPEGVTSAPTEEQQTEPGTVMGTAGYMSPEQVRGLPLDQRSDIFSFGAVLYEMLTGKRAFQGRTPADTMSAILKEEPPEPSESGRSISPALDRVVRHCLEKDADSRFQSAGDIGFALSEVGTMPVSETRPPGRSFVTRPLAAAIAVLVVLLFAAVLVFRRTPRDERGSAIKRIAVLPFENLGSPEDDYFADGMADAVRGKLTTLPGIQVIARASSTPYKKSAKSASEIAKELDVAYLLMATVRWQKGPDSSSRVVVRPELVDVSDSRAPISKWQQPFDTVLIDVFQVQSDIASRVAQSMGVVLGGTEERRLEATPTQNLAAYEAFLKGEAAFRDRDEESEALVFYQQAVALDPGFAKAWASVAWVSSWLYGSEKSTAELAETARTGAEKAMALAPESGEAYLALGHYLWLVRNDYNGGLKQLVIGQTLAPSNADLMVARGAIEMNLGRWQEAVSHERQAERLDPRSPDPKIFLGTALMLLRRFSEAREVLDQGTALAPGLLPMFGTKANLLLARGDLAAARSVLKASTERNPTTIVAFAAYFVGVWVLDEEQRQVLLRLTPAAFGEDRARWGLCLAEASSLQKDATNLRKYAEEAGKAFDEQLRVAPQKGIAHSNLGVALAYLGRKDEAIREGQRGLALAAARDGIYGVFLQYNLVRIEIILGEQEKALDGLERLLVIPSGMTSGRLRIDSTFDPLRKNPRFQKLVAETK